MSRQLTGVTLLSAGLILAACGGGGGSGSGSSGAALEPQDVEPPAARMLSYGDDIAPILEAKCIGCHNSGDNPLAPFSLEGAAVAESFKSAIHFAVAGGTMPPEGALQLTGSERDKLIAWATGAPYSDTAETLRVALVEPEAWDVQPTNRDVFPEHRPDQVDCPHETGWLVVEGTL